LGEDAGRQVAVRRHAVHGHLEHQLRSFLAGLARRGCGAREGEPGWCLPAHPAHGPWHFAAKPGHSSAPCSRPRRCLRCRSKVRRTRRSARVAQQSPTLAAPRRTCWPQSRRSQTTAEGQQATLTGTLRVFVLTVRNREAKQASPGQERSVQPIRDSPQSRHSQQLYSVYSNSCLCGPRTSTARPQCSHSRAGDADPFGAARGPVQCAAPAGIWCRPWLRSRPACSGTASRCRSRRT
jgi:hypothetical protein